MLYKESNTYRTSHCRTDTTQSASTVANPVPVEDVEAEFMRSSKLPETPVEHTEAFMGLIYERLEENYNEDLLDYIISGPDENIRKLCIFPVMRLLLKFIPRSFKAIAQILKRGPINARNSFSLQCGLYYMGVYSSNSEYKQHIAVCLRYTSIEIGDVSTILDPPFDADVQEEITIEDLAANLFASDNQTRILLFEAIDAHMNVPRIAQIANDLFTDHHSEFLCNEDLFYSAVRAFADSIDRSFNSNYSLAMSMISQTVAMSSRFIEVAYTLVKKLSDSAGHDDDLAAQCIDFFFDYWDSMCFSVKQKAIQFIAKQKKLIYQPKYIRKLVSFLDTDDLPIVYNVLSALYNIVAHGTTDTLDGEAAELLIDAIPQIEEFTDSIDERIALLSSSILCLIQS